MCQQDTFRKVIASIVIAAAFAISAVTGSSVSADGGQHEVGHWMGMAPPLVEGTHSATDVTMKRGVIGAPQSITVGSNQAETYAPGLTKYPVVKLQRVGSASEPHTELVPLVFHEIK